MKKLQGGKWKVRLIGLLLQVSILVLVAFSVVFGAALEGGLHLAHSPYMVFKIVALVILMELVKKQLVKEFEDYGQVAAGRASLVRPNPVLRWVLRMRHHVSRK